MTNAILGTFADAKSIKTRGVYQLLIEIPIENADHALRVLGGIPQPAEERWVGIAPVAAPKKPADETTTAERVKGTDDWSDAKRKMVQQSGMVRKEGAFRYWLYWREPKLWAAAQVIHSDDPYKVVSEVVHTLCGVDSCADLEPGGRSGVKWQELVTQYRDSQHGLGDAQQEQREAGP